MFSPAIRIMPTSLLHNLNKVLHERVLFVTVQNGEPEIAPERRTEVRTRKRHPPRHFALRLHGKSQHPSRAGRPEPAVLPLTRCRQATLGREVLYRR